MLGVGWTEMLVIGLVALIFIGPKDLPAVMNRVGKFAATIRRMGQEFQRELNKTTGLNEITNLRNSVTAPLRATADAIRKEFNTTTAAGTVQPSGALKPADPKVESVVSEIQKVAGIAPAAEATPAVVPAVVTPTVAAAPAPVVTPVALAKPRRTPKIKVPTPDTPVVAADLPAAPSVAVSAEAAAPVAVTPAAKPATRRKVAAVDAALATDATATPAAPRKPRAKSVSTATADGDAPKPTRARKPAAPKKG
jgi:sec-independent protein translocase protein TatB